MITALTLSLLIIQTLAKSSPPNLNISRYIYPLTTESSSHRPPQPNLFLQDVLDSISDKEKWNKSEGIRVSRLDLGKAKYGTSLRYDIRTRFGKSDLVVKLWDGVSRWNKFDYDGAGGGGVGDFEDLVGEMSPNAVIDSLRVRGPVELLVAGDDEISVSLPMNVSHSGLKRVLVGEGISLELKGAQGVSLFHTAGFGLETSSHLLNNKEQSGFWSFQHAVCMPLPPIKISGSSSVVVYRTLNPEAHIETALLSQETLELLPDKCYSYRKQACPVESLRVRISVLERLLRWSLGEKVDQKAVRGGFKAKVQAFNVFSFQLELERDVGRNDTRWTTMAEWRTRPSVERVWYEVLARTESKRLKTLMVKKVKPFVGVDSEAWSNLMSNISFTKFPPLLVSQEALTLDVKW